MYGPLKVDRLTVNNTAVGFGYDARDCGGLSGRRVFRHGVARDRVRCLLRSYCPDYRSVRSPYQHHLRDTVSHPH